MADEGWYKLNRPKAPPRQPKPGERLFEFKRGPDRFVCELRDHGAYGVEAAFYKNEEFLYSRRFDRQLDSSRPPRDRAAQWATEERLMIEAAYGVL